MGMSRSNPRPTVDFTDSVDRAKQSFKEESDINVIMGRFEKTGLVTHLAKGVPQFLDVSEVGDFRGALEVVQTATSFFQGLPAKVRAAFQNDPAIFLDAVDDPTQLEKFKELGLLPVVEKQKPVVPPAAPAAPPGEPPPPGPEAPASS